MSIKTYCIRLLYSLLFTFVFTISGFSMEAADTAKYVDKMVGIINSYTGVNKTTFSSYSLVINEYTRTIKGKVSFLGVSDIDYNAEFNSVDSLVFFSVKVPDNRNAGIGPFNLKGMLGFNPDYFFIPGPLKNALAIDSCSLMINAESSLLSTVYFDFKLLGGWKIFEDFDLSLTKVGLGIRVTNPYSPSNIKFEGELAGEFDWYGTGISLSSNLTTDPKDWELNAVIKNLTFGNILGKFGLDEPDLVIPSFIRDKGLNELKVKVKPLSGVEMLATTDIGVLNLMVQRYTVPAPVKKDTAQKEATDYLSTQLTGSYKKDTSKTAAKNTLNTQLTGGYKTDTTKASSSNNLSTQLTGSYKTDTSAVNKSTAFYTSGTSSTNTSSGSENKLSTMLTGSYQKNAVQSKWGILAGFSFPENFAFGNFIPEIGFLDKYIQPNNKGFYISTFSGKPSFPLPLLRMLGDEITIVKGVTFIGGMDFTKVKLGKAGDLSKITGVNYLTLQATIPANPANLYAMAAINFSNRLNIAGKIYMPDLFVKIDAAGGDPKLSLGGHLNLDFTKRDQLAFVFGGYVQPLSQTVGVNGAMLNMWENPFGLKGIKFGQLELEAALSFPGFEAIVPDNIMLAGKMGLGDIFGQGRIGFDKEFQRNVVDFGIENISWSDILKSVCGDYLYTKIPKHVTNAINAKLNSARVTIVPDLQPITTMTGEYYSPGFRVAGDGDIAGWHGDFDVNLNIDMTGLSAGLTAKGQMDPINFTDNGFTFFKLAGSNGKGKAEMNLNLNTAVVEKLVASMGKGKDTLNYVNASLTILDVNNASAYILLTPEGYKSQLNGKIFGLLDGTIDAQIAEFSHPMENTYVKVKARADGILADIQNLVTKKILGKGLNIDFLKKGFSIDSIYFAGRLNELKTGIKANVHFTFAGYKKSITISITINGIKNLAQDIADKIGDEAIDIINVVGEALKKAAEEVKQLATKAASEVKEKAEQAVNFAKNTTKDALKAADNLKDKLSSGAKTAVNATKEGFETAAKKTKQFFTDFGKFSKNTAEKIFNKTMDKMEDAWSSFTKAMKNAFTSSDNEELVMVDGPAFRIITKYKNLVVKALPTHRKNDGIIASALQNSQEELWQLIPIKDDPEKGRFMVVNGYTALLMCNPDKFNTLVTIPHESDHHERERIVMEEVPGETGWYFLKYYSGNKYIGAVESSFGSSVFLKSFDAKGNTDLFKFKFERAGTIDWITKKNIPPVFAPAVPMAENGRYQFSGEPEQYLYTKGNLRWIPDTETLAAMGLDKITLTALPYGTQAGYSIINPLPSRKDGIVIQATGAPEIYILENGKKRWIPDPQTFTAMKLTPDMILTFSKEDVQAIPTGDPLPAGFAPKITLQERAIYQVAGDAKIYVVINKNLRLIPDPETLSYMGYNGNMIQTITQQDLNNAAKGTILPSRRDGSLIQLVGDLNIYIMEKGIKRLIPDKATFTSMNLDINKVQKISKEDFNEIVNGPAIIVY